MLHTLSYGLLSLGVTLFALVCLRVPFLRLGLVDQPSERKRHGAIVPVSGGAAIALAVAAMFLWAGVPSSWWQAYAIACGMLVVGLLDDWRSQPVAVRLGAQVLAGVLLVIAGFKVDQVGAPGSLGIFSGVFTVLCVVTFINACNMVDGLDGLLGAVLLPGTVALAWIETGSTAFVAITVAGALAAFLICNWPCESATPRARVRTFFGNGGAMFVATLCAALLLSAVHPHGKLPAGTVALLTLIPLAEIANTCMRRIVRGVSVVSPDREHIHHRLIDARWSVQQVAWVYVGVASGGAALAALAVRLGTDDRLAWILAAILLGTATLVEVAPDLRRRA